MELAIQAAGAAGLLLAGIGLIFGGIQLGRIRELLRRSPVRVLVLTEGSSCCRDPRWQSGGGYAIYVYRKDTRRWSLEHDLSAPGFEPAPPTIAGSYDNQTLRTQSLPAHRT